MNLNISCNALAGSTCNTPSPYLPPFIIPLGKSEVECHYDMTQIPSSSKEVGPTIETY